MRRDLQIRITLVVAKENVVARVERLDQVVLEQQRLGLGANDRRLHPNDLADHVADARAAVVLLEVARHALAQIARLADVEHRVLRVEIAVHAGQAGQRRHIGQQTLARRVDRRFVSGDLGRFGHRSRLCRAR